MMEVGTIRLIHA